MCRGAVTVGIYGRRPNEIPVTRRIRLRRIVVSSVAYPYAKRRRALGTAVALVGSWLFVGDLDELLADVLAGEERASASGAFSSPSTTSTGS